MSRYTTVALSNAPNSDFGWKAMTLLSYIIAIAVDLIDNSQLSPAAILNMAKKLLLQGRHIKVIMIH